MCYFQFGTIIYSDPNVFGRQRRKYSPKLRGIWSAQDYSIPLLEGFSQAVKSVIFERYFFIVLFGALWLLDTFFAARTR